MGKLKLRILALSMVLILLLTGCGFAGGSRRVKTFLEQLSYRDIAVYPYGEMTYERPDMQAFDRVLQRGCAAAAGCDNPEDILDSVFEFYDAYDSFYTNYYLADIRYSGDLTNAYWEEEYTYCMENYPAADAGLERLYMALADSPLRGELEAKYFGTGFFDAYDGESVWDETFTALMEQEIRLQNAYYELSGQAAEAEPYSDAFFTTYGAEMGTLFVELIGLRQEIAAYMGYDSYVDFAYDFYYSRDYTPAETEQYLKRIRQELVPLYRELMTSDLWQAGSAPCSEEDALNYLRETSRNMGGITAEAFYVLETGGLYDISYGANKYNSSFEVYLDSYREPFLFMNPSGTVYDKLTLAHEFGHFTNDYCCGGSYAGVDVAEVMSQGMEFMSLCYGTDTEELEKLKLADSLCTMVEQAAYATFEQQVYAISPEELTTETVYALYEQIGLEFGMDSWNWDSRDFVTVTHFYTNPIYIISYVASCDAALQLYQMEKAAAGQGLTHYERILSSEETGFLAFIRWAELTSPFEEDRMQQIRQTFEEGLQS